MTTPTPTTVQVKIQLRRDTAAAWASVNPVLLAGEAGLETDTNKIKIGNGSTAWNSLGYFPFVVSGGTVTGNLEIGTTGTLTFEGSSADNFETTLGVINPTADRTINLPNVSGTIITTGDTGTVTSTMIADGTIVNADVSASAAIAHSKLANITAGFVLIGNASNVPTATQVTGDVTISDTGVTAISSGAIVDADVSASAEIAVSKLADGAARQLLQTDAAGTGVEWTSNVDIPGTLDVTGTATFDGAVTVAGDLTVNGTTTTISTQNLLVEDKNIILGDVATPSDTTADGGGITLKGATDKTINWVDSTDAWTSSERFSVPLGSAASPSLTFTGDENSGVYSPGADQVAISTGGSGRLFVDSSGYVSIGTTNNPAAAQLMVTKIGGAQGFEFLPGSSTTVNTILNYDRAGSAYLTSAVNALDHIWQTSGTERLRITSAGLVGVGTSSPNCLLEVKGGSAITTLANSYTNCGVLHQYSSTSLLAIGNDGTSPILQGVNATNNTARNLLLNPLGGSVGIGTTSPGSLLTVSSASGGTLANITNTSDADFQVTCTSGVSTIGPTVGQLAFRSVNSERGRFDASGRLLVGTSSSITNALEGAVQIVGTAADAYLTLTRFGGANTSAPAGIILGRSRSGTKGTNTAVSDGDFLGVVEFTGADGGSSYRPAAQIGAYVDGVVSGGGAADMPGRLVFSTTADGASSPTERMRIQNDGNVIIGKAGQTISYQNPGINLFSSGSADFTRASAYLISVNRKTDDGVLVEFYQDNNLEGTISVSGTTVSYNGAHLSRWSQLPSGTERTEILRGTVLSNIDEMCEWGDEENEQLNRMKVSDVEGDKNVSGVFQAWDDDDDTYTNDFYCAMTGDFIIRIGAGVTVERGDLLMSAGDGTAKPQDDDIIRSKTIAKVTSTNVSCTYDDGSYCVPCVLMAC